MEVAVIPEIYRTRIQPDPGSGCWLWTGYVNKYGYGRVHAGNAHIAVYRLVQGDFPAGLELDHLCRVRRCVNPAHLEPVTRRINVLRGENPAARNARKTHCTNGHEFTAENTYAYTRRGTPRRACRDCGRRNTQRYLTRQSTASTSLAKEA